MDQSSDEPTADGEPPDPMHPGAQPGAEGEDDGPDDANRASSSEGEHLWDEEGALAPGMPKRYEGSPGAALATETEEDVPEPNEPA